MIVAGEVVQVYTWEFVPVALAIAIVAIGIIEWWSRR